MPRTDRASRRRSGRSFVLPRALKRANIQECIPRRPCTGRPPHLPRGPHDALGIWSKRDSQGTRSTDKDRNLSEEEASELRELIESIRLSEPSQPGECWEDTASLTLLLRDAGGTEHRYPTDPERQACNGAELFANKGDVQAFLDACRALLPEPIL